MDAAELLTIIDKGEGTRVEFKLRPPSRIKLAKLISAFANTQGGDIIIGVDDDAVLVGVDSIEYTKAAIVDAIGLIEPEPLAGIVNLRIEDKNIVICHIKKGDHKPFKITIPDDEAKTYIRVGSSIYPVSHTDEGRLSDEDVIKRSIRLTPIHHSLLDTIGKDHGVTVAQLAHKHNLSQQRVLKLLMLLIRAGMVFEKEGGKYELR